LLYLLMPAAHNSFGVSLALQRDTAVIGADLCRVFSNDVPKTSSTTMTSPTNVTETKTIESTKVNNPYTSISTTSMSSSPMHNPTSRELWPDDCRAHVSTSPSEITGHLNKNYKYASTCRLRKELKTD